MPSEVNGLLLVENNEAGFQAGRGSMAKDIDDAGTVSNIISNHTKPVFHDG